MLCLDRFNELSFVDKVQRDETGLCNFYLLKSSNPKSQHLWIKKSSDTVQRYYISSKKNKDFGPARFVAERRMGNSTPHSFQILDFRPLGPKHMVILNSSCDLMLVEEGFGVIFELKTDFCDFLNFHANEQKKAIYLVTSTEEDHLLYCYSFEERKIVLQSLKKLNFIKNKIVKKMKFCDNLKPNESHLIVDTMDLNGLKREIRMVSLAKQVKIVEVISPRVYCKCMQLSHHGLWGVSLNSKFIYKIPF